MAKCTGEPWSNKDRTRVPAVSDICQRMSGWEPLGHFASSVKLLKGKPPSTTPTEVILHGTHNVHHCSNYQMMRFTTSFNHTQHMGRLFPKCLYFFFKVYLFFIKGIFSYHEKPTKSIKVMLHESSWLPDQNISVIQVSGAGGEYFCKSRH